MCPHTGVAEGGGELGGAVAGACTGTAGTTALVGTTNAGCNETATALAGGLLNAIVASFKFNRLIEHPWIYFTGHPLDRIQFLR